MVTSVSLNQYLHQISYGLTKPTLLVLRQTNKINECVLFNASIFDVRHLITRHLMPLGHLIRIKPNIPQSP
jgi:hypothetical protein